MNNSKQAESLRTTQPTELFKACCMDLSLYSQLSIWQVILFLIHGKVSGRVANTSHFTLTQFSRDFNSSPDKTEIQQSIRISSLPFNGLGCSNVYLELFQERSLCISCVHTFLVQLSNMVTLANAACERKPLL